MLWFAILIFLIAAIVFWLVFQQRKNSQTNPSAYLISRAALIAAIYALVTYVFEPISYGPVQVRISEALTLLPLMDPAAVPGLFVGCLIANILGGLGLWDICLGSLITFLAAYITSKMPNPFLGAVPPIVLNALGVAFYLSKIYSVPYIATVLYIGLGELISVAGIGIPLFYLIQRTNLRKIFNKK